MRVQWDFQELINFGNNLKQSYGIDTALMTATQKIARVLHQYLLNNTPVDTGNLRKMWSAGDNLAFTVEQVNNGFKVTFINLAQNPKGEQYGRWVNDGHKTPSGNGWVMGRFFVEKSIINTGETGRIEQIVMEELQKWWGSL